MSLVDGVGRSIDYLRLSVTDRCDFRCVYCMAKNMTFLPRQQVLGQPDHALWADPAQRTAYLEQLAEHRRTERVAARSRRADGSEFDALVSSEMSDDPGDRLVITTIIDVSAQNEAMERLRKSEERFAKAFNFSPLNMAITRLSDGTYLEANVSRDSVQGYRGDELRGRTSLETGVWSSAGERAAFVERLRREAQATTERIHRLFEQLPIMVAYHGPRPLGVCLFANRRYAQMFDLDEHSIVGKTVAEMMGEHRQHGRFLGRQRHLGASQADRNVGILQPAAGAGGGHWRVVDRSHGDSAVGRC